MSRIHNLCRMVQDEQTGTTSAQTHTHACEITVNAENEWLQTVRCWHSSLNIFSPGQLETILPLTRTSIPSHVLLFDDGNFLQSSVPWSWLFH